MPRDLRARENQQRAKAKRESALARREFSRPSEPRQAAAGATSFAVKTTDPSLARMIAEHLEKIANRRSATTGAFVERGFDKWREDIER